MAKDQKINELNPLANQAKTFQSRIELQQKDIENLRQKMKDEQTKHKSEIEALRKENLKVRTLESEVKSMTNRMEKAAANHEQNLEKVNKKLEREKETNAKLQERMKNLDQMKDQNEKLTSKIKLLEQDVEKYMKDALEQKSMVVQVEETWKTKYHKLEGESMKWKIKAEEYEVSNQDLQKRII